MAEKHADAASRKPAPQSYLLNIYPPHSHGKDAALVGTVEKLGNEGKHAFHNIQELMHLLGIDEITSGGRNHEQAK